VASAPGKLTNWLVECWTGRATTNWLIALPPVKSPDVVGRQPVQSERVSAVNRHKASDIVSTQGDILRAPVMPIGWLIVVGWHARKQERVAWRVVSENGANIDRKAGGAVLSLVHSSCFASRSIWPVLVGFVGGYTFHLGM